ncbi:MAG: hypothetical protein GY718_10155 [Lentisphaerae bacterium]|nr:hypothetical protein [Lentisphaerota bacterium]
MNINGELSNWISRLDTRVKAGDNCRRKDFLAILGAFKKVVTQYAQLERDYLQLEQGYLDLQARYGEHNE